MIVRIISDAHCGSWAGLTPPSGDNPLAPGYKARRQAWGLFVKGMASPVDLLIVNGDMIDGPSKKAGGRGLLTVDPGEQADMAVDVIRVAARVKAPICMTVGTPYHVGTECDWEGEIAKRVEAKRYQPHLFPVLEGVPFSVKHKIGSAQLPQSRHTASARARLQNILWAEEWKGHPKARMFVRSHVHYYGGCFGIDWASFTTPGLQSLSNTPEAYGVRECEGVVHWGWVEVVCEKGTFDIQPHVHIITASLPQTFTEKDL